jgi:diguanylate cyclase (GGDEF)-like protein
LTQREEQSLDDLAAVLRFDPALTGKLMRLANLARAAGATPVGSVEVALRRLGASTVRNAALGFTLLPAGRSGACGNFDHDAFWSYGIACALAAEAIASDGRVADPERATDGGSAVDPGDAFTCGLLSRIGMLALATVHSDTYDRVLAGARGRAPEMLLLDELRHFDIQHWEVSAAMLAEWSLPDSFVGAVMSLGQPKRDPGLEDPTSEPLAQVLRSASLVAHRLLDGVATQGALGEGWLDLLGPVGGGLIHHGRLVSLCARVAPAWRAWCERLRLPTATLGEDEIATNAFGDDGFDDALSGALSADPAVEAVVNGDVRLATGELRVLIVDDDPRMLRLLEHHLHAAGYAVTTAGDGRSALAMIAEHPPHILVTDWLMPGMTGGELVQALRTTEAGQQVYTLILTSRDEDDQIVAAFDAGADDFVAKPYNARVLLARVAAGHRMVELQRQVRVDRERRSAQVAEMGLLTRKLHSAAHTDVLTELPNRRYAMKRLEQEWAYAEQMDRPLSVLVVDVDHFKLVNDRHGHDVGDEVLRSTASVLRARTRRADVVCRLGGEEFLVINVNSDTFGASMCAERLRRSVEENVIRARAFEGRVSISIGLATRGEGIATVHELLKAADQAVYAAKAAGRNVVRRSQRCLPESA